MATRASRRLPARDRILRVARRLLAKYGHERLSLRAVARNAGFAPSSLYEHFEDRRALLEALALRALAELRDSISVVCHADVPATVRLVNAAMAYLEFASQRTHEFQLCFSRTQPADQTALPPHSALLPVALEIGRALEEGEFVAPPGFDALDIAVSLWSQVHGMAVLRVAYFAELEGFEEKARQLITASIESWRP